MSAEVTDKENVEPDNINVGLVATIAVVGALLVLSIALALTALVRSESSAFGTEIGTYANLGTVKRLKAEQAAKLAEPPSWADKDKGKVALPIERAMLLVTSEIQKNPEAATAVAAPGAATASAATPAPTGDQPAATGANETDKAADKTVAAQGSPAEK
jgi:hypothetical protein